jgi:hypothetical protein
VHASFVTKNAGKLSDLAEIAGYFAEIFSEFAEIASYLAEIFSEFAEIAGYLA